MRGVRVGPDHTVRHGVPRVFHEGRGVCPRALVSVETESAHVDRFFRFCLALRRPRRGSSRSSPLLIWVSPCVRRYLRSCLRLGSRNHGLNQTLDVHPVGCTDITAYTEIRADSPDYRPWPRSARA